MAGHAAVLASQVASGWQATASLAGSSRPTGEAILRGRVARRPKVTLAASRGQLKATLFKRLDVDGDGRLVKEELRRFAQFTGFDGDEADWADEYGGLCESFGLRPSQGLDATAFGELVDDEDCYCEDGELEDMLSMVSDAGVSSASVPRASSSRSLGPKRQVGLDYFRGERQAGLYETALKPWDPAEGTASRSPRLGRVDGFDGCPSTATAEEAVMFLYEQAREGVFGSHTRLAEEVCSQVLAAAGKPDAVGWYETRLDELALSEEELGKAVLAPQGWDVVREAIPQGYMEHIVTVGRGLGATLGAGDTIVNALHRDVSKCRRLCDTLLIGVVGRKRVIYFAPDEFDVDVSFPRKPDFSYRGLREMSALPEHEAWARLEGLAQQQDVIGGVVTLEPGMVLYVPHGWWHAVKPIDAFTLITGPSALSNCAPPEKS